MVLDSLSESLRGTLKKIASSLFVDEKLINELVKDIQRALLRADVNVQLVFSLSEKIKARAMKESSTSLTKKEQLINIVYDELVAFLGSEEKQIDITTKPTYIFLVGLFGSGKTTTCAKLAKYYQKRGIRVALLGTDTWRPAAYEQLKQLSAQINVPCFGNPKKKNPNEIFEEFESELKNFDLVIVDTAGRDALSEELISELDSLYKKIKPKESILVLSADLGQTAQAQAKKFNETCHVSGVIITKLEGTAKGGGALSACAITGAPVLFIGVGEKVDDLEKFNPKGFVGRLLGMGDLEALLEKAKESFSEKKAEDMTEKLLSGKFSLLDMYEQMDALRKMGPLSKVMEMIPGFSGASLPKEMISVQEEKLKKWRYIMDSMSKEELDTPDLLTQDRIERIAKGSGSNVLEVRELIKQYKQSQKLAKMFKGGSPKDMKKVMKQFGGKLPPGFKL